MYDDFSYIRTAQIFAQTGHIVYNGWATAMLGWQILPAALLLKIFGFSFTVARVATLLVAMVTTALIQRTFVRAGIQEWNATLATLTLTLSPLFLPLAFSFMSDMYGLLAVVFCFYCCLRALESQSPAGWLVLAIASNALGGTARQIAWAAFLTMVPVSGMLLWRRGLRRGWFVVAISYIVGIAAIAAALYWFNQQPFSVPEHILQGRVTSFALTSLADNMARLTLTLALLCLPILVACIPALRRSRMAAGMVAAASLLGLYLHYHGTLKLWLPPFLSRNGNYLSVHGLYTIWPTKGSRSLTLSRAFRGSILVLSVLGCSSLFALRQGKKEALPVWTYPLLAFVVGYLALLVPRATFVWLFDRYALPLLFCVLILITRLYQGNKGAFPRATALGVVLMAAYSVAVTHDLFAMFRASLEATRELQAGGVPRRSIDGGWEYNSWTQITTAGYIHDPHVHVPSGIHIEPLSEDHSPCRIESLHYFSAVRPRYSFSTEPNDCGGRTDFSPVTYHTWLPYRSVTIYVVRSDFF